MKRLGITGGIGSGKSTVCECFARRGIPIYDSDSRAKELMNTSLIQPIEELFGRQAYINGELNRAHIASVAFDNPDVLKQLNAVVHPAVGVDFEQWSESFGEDVPFVVLESAILFESGFDSRVDAVLFVDAPTEVRIARTMQRDGSDRDAVEKRIARQQTDQARAKADFVINNSRNDDLKSVVDEVIVKLNRLWK